MAAFKPFSDDAASLALAGLTVENGTARVALYGSLDITADKEGLAHARTLLALLTDTVAALEARPDLPAKPAAPAPAKTVKNPFA